MVTNLKSHPFDDALWLFGVMLLSKFGRESDRLAETTEPVGESESAAFSQLIHETCQALWDADMLFLPKEEFSRSLVALVRNHKKAEPIQLVFALYEITQIFGRYFKVQEIDVSPTGEVISIEAYLTKREVPLEDTTPRLGLTIVRDETG